MDNTRSRRVLLAAAGVAALAVPLAACSTGGGGESADGSVEITFLVPNAGTNVESAEAMIAAFEEENADITVKVESQPAGTEGDNLMKTKLATGEMADVFWYNSGSLFQALNPDQNLAPLTDESWVGDMQDTMKAV